MATTKTPHVQVTARFTIKNPPAEHRGLASEVWTFGRETDAPFWPLAYALIRRLIEFYFNAHPEVSEEAMTEQVGRLGEAISGLRLEEPKEAADATS